MNTKTGETTMVKKKKIDLGDSFPACLRGRAWGNPDPRRVKELKGTIEMISAKRREEREKNKS